MFHKRCVLILIVITSAIYLVRNDEQVVPSKKATTFEPLTVNPFELTKVAKDQIFLDLKTALKQPSTCSVSDILREVGVPLHIGTSRRRRRRQATPAQEKPTGAEDPQEDLDYDGAGWGASQRQFLTLNS